MSEQGEPVFLGSEFRLADELKLRDYFAAHAPEPPPQWRGGDRAIDDLVAWRWRYADAMLKARQR